MQGALRIAAKRKVELERVHTVPVVARRCEVKGAGRRYLELYTVTRMARDFKVIRLTDEFGQHVLHLKYASCGHERRSFPDKLAHRCGWDAQIVQLERPIPWRSLMCD
jgi:hypothetical protein